MIWPHRTRGLPRRGGVGGVGGPIPCAKDAVPVKHEREVPLHRVEALPERLRALNLATRYPLPDLERRLDHRGRGGGASLNDRCLLLSQADLVHLAYVGVVHLDDA